MFIRGLSISALLVVLTGCGGSSSDPFNIVEGENDNKTMSRLSSESIYDELGDLEVVVTYNYNTDGTLASLDYAETSEFVDYYEPVYTYNDQGKLSRRDDYDEDGVLTSHYVYSYNSEGRVSEYTYTNFSARSGTTVITTTNDYDGGSKVVRQYVDSDEDGITDDINTNTYDSSGLLVRTESEGYYMVRVYDNRDLLSAFFSYSTVDDSLFYSSSYEFNERGQITEADVDYNGDGIQNAHYEYTWEEGVCSEFYGDDSDPFYCREY